MYIPAHFAEPDLATLHAFIESFPFATLISESTQGLEANHLPVLLNRSAGVAGQLRGHVARANPVWKSALPDREVLLIFHGPQGYISPSWYPSKQQHGKVVPTWNYSAVHAYARLVAIESPEWLHSFINDLTDLHERNRAQPWRVADAPAQFIDKMLGAIVGLEMEITRISGKMKMSQNRPTEDRLGVISGLREEPECSTGSLADWVSKFSGRP